MTALLFLVSSAVLGAGLVRRVFGRLLDGAERAMWGLVVGWMLSGAVAYVVARGLGGLSKWPLVVLTCALCVGAVLVWLDAWKRLLVRGVRVRGLWRGRQAGLALVLVLFAPVFGRLFWTHMLQEGSEGVYSGGSCWYDMGLHMALSTSFLYGQNFPPVYTPFPPAPLLYPFLPDFQTAALVALGVDFRTALLISSIPLALALTGIFYGLARRILQDQTRVGVNGRTTNGVGDSDGARSPADGSTPEDAQGSERERADIKPQAQAASVLATCLFMLNGGLGFLYFYGDWRRSRKSLWDFWRHLEVNYANMGGERIQWTNFVADTLLPQRASLYGYAAGFIILTLFAVAWQRWSEGREASDAGARRGWCGWRLLLPAGALAGLLPFFHTHTYLAVGLVSGFLFLLRPRRAWLAFWLPAVLIALPHFIQLTGHATAVGFIRFQPGWRGHNETNWPLYWLRNVGLPVLLILPAWLSAPRVWRTFYLAFVALLVFSLLVVVSPNDYDNIKLMYYWYAPTCALNAAWLVRLAQARRRRFLARTLAALLALACVASGLLALQFESLSHKLFFSREESDAARYVREHTAPRSLFVTAPTVHQPILSLAGRPILRGDTAWLWSHGYDFPAREADIRAIYAGGAQALELLDYYHIDYVYLGTREREILKARQDFFESTFPAVFRTPNIAIYDAHAPPTTREAATTAAAAPSAASVPADDNPTWLREGFAPREFASRLDKDPYQLLVEFPRAAYAVYRLYKVAYGRAPRYDELTGDMRIVGRGLYVSAPGWQQVLEQNTRTLADALVRLEAFRAAHDSQTNQQYVDALYANARVAPAEPERRALVADLDARRATRASVLARVADDPQLYRRDYNAAYVLMHYFGYLRRNPDDPPDTNLDGYNFWLTDLNRTGDYRSVTRVFIESGEYKDQKSFKSQVSGFKF